MKPGNTQLGMRENPASLGQHGSRLAVQSVAASSARPPAEEQESSQAPPATSRHELPVRFPSNAARTAATGGEQKHDDHLLTVREVASMLQVPVSWVYERTRRRGPEQLPHIKLGKYLRFEESIIREFIEEQRRA
jgi:predicted DNA-binding transcriptional regulator AlpA